MIMVIFQSLGLIKISFHGLTKDVQLELLLRSAKWSSAMLAYGVKSFALYILDFWHLAKLSEEGAVGSQGRSFSYGNLLNCFA